MKLYDANAMVGTWVRDRVHDLEAGEMVKLSAELGIEKTVAYHADARSLNPIPGNAKLMEACKDFPSIVPCWIVSPHYKYNIGWDALAQLLEENRIRFIRLFPSEHGYTLGSVHVTDMLNIAAKLKLIVQLGYEEILLRETETEENPYFEELCRRYPDVRFVLSEAPHRRNMMWYSFLENHPNVYVEMSLNNNWLTYEQTVKLFGSEKLLWGSRMPFSHPGPSLSMLAYAEISDEDKANIGYRNLQRLMGRE